MANSFKDGMIVKSEGGWTAYIIGNDCKVVERSGTIVMDDRLHNKDILTEGKHAWQFVGWQKEHNVRRLLEKIDGN